MPRDVVFWVGSSLFTVTWIGAFFKISNSTLQDLSQILYPREVIIHDANDPSMYMYPYMSPTHKNVVSFKPEVTRNLSDDDYSL